MIKLCILAGLHFDEQHSKGTDFVTYNRLNKRDLRQGYKKVTNKLPKLLLK